MKLLIKSAVKCSFKLIHFLVHFLVHFPVHFFSVRYRSAYGYTLQAILGSFNGLGNLENTAKAPYIQVFCQFAFVSCKYDHIWWVIGKLFTDLFTDQN